MHDNKTWLQLLHNVWEVYCYCGYQGEINPENIFMNIFMFSFIHGATIFKHSLLVQKKTWQKVHLKNFSLMSAPLLVYLSYYSYSLFIAYRVPVDIYNFSSLAFAHSPVNFVSAQRCLLGEHAVSNVEWVSVQKTVSCCQEQHRWEPRAKKTFINFYHSVEQQSWAIIICWWENMFLTCSIRVFIYIYTFRLCVLGSFCEQS